MTQFRWSLWLAALTLAALPRVAFAQGPPYTFTKIQVPGSVFTHAYGINNDGTVVGTYLSSTGKTRGFKYANGTFTDLEYPGATHSYALGINDVGGIVGTHSFTGPNGPWHSFVLAGGVFTEFDPPTWESDARNINNSGDAVGVYNAGGTLPTHGFVRKADGTFQTLDYPGAQYSLLNGINDAGIVSGSYIAGSGVYHGYFYANNEVTGFDFPGAQGTFAADVNNQNVIVGTQSQAGADHAFVLTGSSFRSFDAPFTGVTHTRAWGINDSGRVVGNYTSPDCLSGCGFIAVPNAGAATCQQTISGTYAEATLTINFTLKTTATTRWDVWAFIAGLPTRLWSLSLPAVSGPVAVPIPGLPPLGKVSLLSMLSTTAKGVLCGDVAFVDTGTP